MNLVTIINSNGMSFFRKLFLKRILNHIKTHKATYCCYVEGFYSWFICWKELKEVKDNMNSNYLRDSIKSGLKTPSCAIAWFTDRCDRVAFLKECLAKFE